MKFNCLNCSKEKLYKKTTRTDTNKYCGILCQNAFQFKTVTLPKFYNGEIRNRKTLIRILTHLFGYKCVLCGNVGEHNDRPLSLQLDHVDGNSDNDMPENVRLLCPNCHSQTDTFTARNKGNGRRKRNR